MSAELADRRDPAAGGTVPLDAVQRSEDLKSISRYELLSELGRGAMARVYLARDPNINRKVALKVLEPRGLASTIDEEELRLRFLLEARAAGNLRHPSAVAIYDADHDADTGLSFIAMEWVDGQTLDELLKATDAPLPLDRALAIIGQVASALDAAHEQGLIHRDVKPANILLDKEGNAKLSDFGIAKTDALGLTYTGQVLGTPNYMSPEQLRDEELDGRSDLFALGVVLYQCLTGQQPFQADSIPALAHKILHASPTPPRSLNAGIPPSVASSMLRVLEKRPDERFQSGAKLVEALEPTASPPTQTVDLTHPSQQAQAEEIELFDPQTEPKKEGHWGTLFLVLLTIAALFAIWRSDSSPTTVSRSGQPTPTEAVPPAVEPEPPSQTATAEKAIEPPAEDAAAVEAPPPRAAPGATSNLQISYTNRLKSAKLDVWVDGRHVLSRNLYAPRGFIKRAVGRTFLETIPVAPGHHDVKVRIRGSAGKIEASNRSGNLFDKGQTRRLRAELIPPSYLKLAWK